MCSKLPRIGLILARAKNGVIGQNGVMPWHLPEDLAHFRRVTQGHPVIMGRRTWESITPRFRPLPGRRNIVLTRQSEWQAAGAETAHDLHAAIVLCADAPLAWVIGGAQIYVQAEPLATIAEITEIHATYAGDAYAPTLGAGWCEISREPHVAENGMRYSFARHERDGDCAHKAQGVTSSTHSGVSCHSLSQRHVTACHRHGTEGLTETLHYKAG